MNLGQLEGAVADFDRTIALGLDRGAVRANRGLAKMNLGDNEGAIVDFDRAIELDPGSAAAISLNRGLARQNLGDDAGALASWEEALRLGLDPDWTAQVRGFIAEAKKRLAQGQ